MRTKSVWLVVLALAVSGCSGDDDVDAGENGDASADTDTGDGAVSDDRDDVPTGQSADFDLTTLPEDFPAELVPPIWDTGQYTDDLGLPTATFESSMPFEEIITYYDSVHGDGVVVGDDPGERLAQWTASPPWIVSVLEGAPATIGITQVPDE